MTSKEWPRLIIAGNGSAALLIEKRSDQWQGRTERDGVVLLLSVRTLASDTERKVVQLKTTMATAELFDGTWFRHPELNALSTSQATSVLAECALGDQLDQGGLSFLNSQNSIELDWTSDVGPRLITREPLPVDQVESYLAAKAYWAWRFEIEWALISYAEVARFRIGLKEWFQEAELDTGKLWTFYADGLAPNGFAILGTSALKQQFRSGFRSSSSAQGILDVRHRLGSPRYGAAALHMQKAYSLFLSTPPDFENAAKESITALESVAKVVSGCANSGTLADAAIKLQVDGRLHPTLAGLLNKLWAYTNAAPGVRHGTPSVPTTRAAEARFVMNASAAASLYLLEID